MEEKKETLMEKLKGKLRIAWQVIKEQFQKLMIFVKENPLLAVAMMALAKSVMSNYNRLMDRRSEQRRRDCGFYDDSLRRWSYSKRKPTKWQAEVIELRRRQGESYRSILDDMGLLK